MALSGIFPLPETVNVPFFNAELTFFTVVFLADAFSVTKNPQNKHRLQIITVKVNIFFILLVLFLFFILTLHFCTLFCIVLNMIYFVHKICAKCVQTQILHTKIYSSFLILASYHIISYNIRQHFFNFVASHTKFRIYFYSYISPLSTEYMYALFLDFSFLGDTPIYILLLHTCMPSISISSDISQYTL